MASEENYISLLSILILSTWRYTIKNVENVNNFQIRYDKRRKIMEMDVCSKNNKIKAIWKKMEPKLG